MQKIKYILFVVISAFSLNLHALEPVLDHQAYVYLNIPLDGANKAREGYNFGFMVDRTLIQADASIDLKPAPDRPALFDLTINQHGIKSFAINGIRFADEYYVYRANEQENGETAIEENGETPAEENGETPAEENGETPAEENGETPAEESGEITAEENGETPTEENGETPAEENGEITAEENGETPTEENGETPAEENGEITAEENGETPTEENGETTAEIEATETGEDDEQKPEQEYGKITNAILNAGKDEQVGIAIGLIIIGLLLAGS